MYREPPWFGRPVGRILFMREIEGMQKVRIFKNHRYPGGFSLGLRVDPTGLPQRNFTITFSRTLPEVPKVWVDGPDDSPHRYSDGSLCMWHPSVPPNERWTRRDGAAALVAHAVVHLLREEWYRKTGDWKGDEVCHGPIDAVNDPVYIKEQYATS